MLDKEFHSSIFCKHTTGLFFCSLLLFEHFINRRRPRRINRVTFHFEFYSPMVRFLMCNGSSDVACLYSII